MSTLEVVLVAIQLISLVGVIVSGALIARANRVMRDEQLRQRELLRRAHD